MKYAKVFGILLSAGMLLVSCGEPVELGAPVHLFGQIAENEIIYGLNYRVCDGEQAISYRIPHEIAEEAYREIFEKLYAVEAYPVTGAVCPEVEFPLYSVSGYDEEDYAKNVAFTWSDGYLYDSDGTVYAFDFDFASLVDEYGMTHREKHDVLDGVSAVAMYWIAQDKDGWKKEWLNPAEDRMISEEIVLTDAVFSDGVLRFSLINTGERTMRTGGTDYSLHVKLDGIWYLVPTLPGTVVWDYMPEIPAGETYEESCYIRNRYGDLPAGTYRVGIDVRSDEGDRTEKSAVYHEFTIE